REESTAESVPSVVILDRSLGTMMAAGGGGSLADLVVARGREVVTRAAAEGPVSLALLRGGLEPRPGGGAGVFEVNEALPLPPPAGGRGLAEVAPLRAASSPRTRIFLVTPFLFDALPGVTVIAAAREPLRNGGIRGVALDEKGSLVVRADPGGAARTLVL